MMQLMSLSCTAPVALSPIQPGSVRPSIDREPACKKSRRLQPSQKETLRSASIRSMFRSPPGNSQEPNSKNQCQLGIWFFKVDSWKVMSGWNIQINPRRIGGQRKSECSAVILSIGDELERP